MKTLTLPTLLLSVLAACGARGTAVVTPPPASAAATKVVLAADPGAAEGVFDAKGKGARNDVVVEGRLSSAVKGQFAFTLMDTELPYCGETNKEDHCKTPWDYCCEAKERIAANSLFVEVRGADGKPMASPSLPDLRLLDKVKVKGKLEADAHGNLVLLANGIFRAERPKLPDDLKWPQ